MSLLEHFKKELKSYDDGPDGGTITSTVLLGMITRAEEMERIENDHSRGNPAEDVNGSPKTTTHEDANNPSVVRKPMTQGEEMIWANAYEAAIAVRPANNQEGYRQLDAIKAADDAVMGLRSFISGRYQTADLRQRAIRKETFVYELTGMSPLWYGDRTERS